MTQSTNSPTASSLIDFDAVAQELLCQRDRQGLTLKQIAVQAGVDASKLTVLTRRSGNLSTDNLMRICDWLGQPVDYFRVGGAAVWLEHRLQDVHGLTEQDLLDMAARRREAAQRQLEASNWLEQQAQLLRDEQQEQTVDADASQQ